MIQRLLTAALAAALVALPAQAQTVIIVRHGEKAGPTGDVDLSAAGQARGEALARALAGAKVTLVLATPLKRTQQTAAATAKAAGVSVAAVGFEGGDAAHAQRVADAARKAGAENTVLIVGHSNTVADIARALGDSAPVAPTDCEYDKMTVLRLEGAGAKAIHARYGAPTEAC
ncbi:histidine phosphatase family protein [Phenylobacterium sp.]|uniref:histidine phosphatase family protein n=1 Tax=Phenylobacterium sp. TaxID=1871053 RepID=UPI0027198016|nr:histidine phosphatase family protein [Phenylobacterium sp.]MDO8801050.1 histidine phosphatase family protein [Phenylobacterium sp.]